MTSTAIRARVTAALIATAAMVFAGVATAIPASAAPVGDYATLSTAFGGSGTVELSASINSPASELVLADGATQVLDLGAYNLTLHNIILGAGSTLTISGTTGVLTVDASDAGTGAYADSRAGIKVPNTASLTISSGTVHATAGGMSAAGIGAWGHGSFDGLGSIAITGGTVTAVGAGLGAGIGGTAVLMAGQGSVSISGGTVTATGATGAAGIGGGWLSRLDTITISGGTVNATGGADGAGIGGGQDGGGAGDILISGGVITATALNNGAGIGSGAYYGGGLDGAGSITITAGTIVANAAGYGAGIGSGYGNQPIDITISTANVTVTSQNGAGIGGGGAGGAGAVTINSGTFTIHSDGGAGIGSGYSSSAGPITINGGSFDITGSGGGAAIGGGIVGGASSILINGGTLTLVSESTAPVIGSGTVGGTGGTIVIATGAVVSVSTDQSGTVIGGTNGSADITVDGQLTILEGSLIVPTTGSLTIGSTGVLRGPGGLSGASPVVNNGSITGSVLVTATDVQVNNYLVTYAPAASVGYTGGTQRVYATSFARAELALADPVADVDVQWFDAAVAGTLFTTSTAIASDITLFPVFALSALPPAGMETMFLLPIALGVLLLGAALVMLRRRSAAAHTITG